MRLVSYRRGRQVRAGLLSGERVLDIEEEAASRGKALPSSVLSILELGEGALKTLRRIERSAHRGAGRSLRSVKLCAPVPNPRKLFCLAGNYLEHIAEGARKGKAGVKLVCGKKYVTPRVFMKPPSTTVCGPGDPIIVPKVGQKIDWEAELAVVIGKRGKYIRRESALDHVAGFTCINDVSERALLIRRRSETEEWDKFFDWLNGKWMDHFAPMGPTLVLRDEIPDPSDLRIRLFVNGKAMQDARTSAMIYDVPNIIEYISAIVTLEPGDVIATGTPSGVGFARGIFLKPGDVVEVEIEKIGTLRNPVLGE